MNILIYGAGVIGSFLCHTLCCNNNGNQVTLLARGKRKAQLEKDGLIIQDYLSQKVTRDNPNLTDNLNGTYDIIFVPMQYGQMWDILDSLALADSPIIVLIGNNMSAFEMERRILEKSKTPKTIVFGFQSTGGNRIEDKTICVSFGGGSMTIGGLHGNLDNLTKSTIEMAFKNTKYKLNFMPNMDTWYKCHLSFILPVIYVCYAVNCDLRNTTPNQRKLIIDATNEAYNLLKSLGYEILPIGDDAYYSKGFKRKITEFMIFIMAKTKLGDLCATDHCRHATEEMALLEKDFYKLIEKNPKCSMPSWNILKKSMPSWEHLKEIYKN